jgi:hypothetical protein
MSGGGGGPNIPFDIIYVIDIDDPSSWEEPSDLMLDLGFNIWYRQKETPNHPYPDVYLGKIEGGPLKAVAKAGSAAASWAGDKVDQAIGDWAYEAASRDYETFKKQNPDATPGDYERLQQQQEDFDTWAGR